MLWYLLGAILFGAGLAFLWEDPQGRSMMLQSVRDGSPKRVAITCAVVCALWPLALLIAAISFLNTIWRRK
jgi:hypothetical protein